MESALRIGQRWGKLARDQVGLPDPLQKGREALQFGAVLLVWVTVGKTERQKREKRSQAAEVPFRECPSRAGLQITLEAAGACRVTEPDRDNDTPWSMLRRMR